MEEKIIISGFGGQGIMLMGKLLTYATLLEEKNVTWLPSYGPQMRGGTANCMVVISTRKIASPYVNESSSLIVMNNPSLDRFEHSVKPGGLILINSSMVKRDIKRKDITIFKIPVIEIAENLGNIRVANMVALGAFVGIKTLVTINSLSSSLKKVLSIRHKDLLNLNKKALKCGFEIASEV